MEEAFASYVERALRDEINIIDNFYHSRRRNGFWVLQLKDAVIGFFGLERRTAESVELRRMYLDREYRGQGLAQRLLARAEVEAVRLGYARMVLSTAEIQRSALAFYRRTGFHELRGEIENAPSHKVVGSGLQRVHFEKDLVRSSE
jgi:GNAT superfamily N-acetyltransferase